MHQATPPKTPPASAEVRRARGSVMALFCANGLAISSLVPWFPEVMARMELSNAALGTAIAAAPLGALATGLLAGPLIARLGSARTAVSAGVLVVLALPLAGVAPGWGAFAAALFWLGSLDTFTDAGMNAHALRVQRRYGRSIINSFHAGWSVSAMTGGLLGVGAVSLGVPMPLYTAGAAALLAVVCLAAYRGLLAGAEESERESAAPRIALRPRSRPAARSVLLLAAFAVLLMLAGGVEDSAASWGAVYMRTELAATAFVAGLPFIACQAMMTVGRVVGDRLTDAFGPTVVGRGGALLAVAGLSGALLLPTPFTTIVGFGLCGLGIATLFPLGLAAAGNIPGVRSGDGVTVVAWLSRMGFFAFPPLVGVLADATSLRFGLLLIPLAAGLAFLLVGTLRAR